MNEEKKHIVPIELLTKYFANETSNEERLEIETWRDSDYINRMEYDAIQKLWSISGEAKNNSEIDIDKEWTNLCRSTKIKKSTPFQFGNFLKIAAVFVIVSSLAFIGYLQLNKTTIGSDTEKLLTNISLPDGSVISLNSESKIAYSKDFGTKNRNVTLKGEAFFEVSKNDKLPFIITANETQIEVVGTVFNVKAYKNSDNIKVTVSEGKVRFYNKRKPKIQKILSAGETGTYNRNKRTIEKTSKKDINDFAWKTLVLDFNNASLKEVTSVLSNTYHKDFKFPATLNNCSITVHFENQDLQSVLKVLESTLDIKITGNDDELILSGKGC